MVYFSLVIPVKSINPYVRQNVCHILQLRRPDWELIILPDSEEETEWGDSRIKIISSGRVGPAKKRDMGAAVAKGEVLVFLDDDSYPAADFLDVAARYFSDLGTVAIGGPGVTPRENSFFQKVSGAVFLSKFSGGSPERYLPIGAVREVDDWPSVNLLVRKTVFLDVGGFDIDYWPGEDTKFCLDLFKETGKKIQYVPELIVWHHRRIGILSHLKQVGGYGLHRGFFAKRYPETSRRLRYFLPSMFSVFFILSLTLLPHFEFARPFFQVMWFVYGLALSKSWVDIFSVEGFFVATAALPLIFLTHLWYGIRFCRGFFLKKLVSKLR